jgi:hypothetical protein
MTHPSDIPATPTTPAGAAGADAEALPSDSAPAAAISAEAQPGAASVGRVAAAEAESKAESKAEADLGFGADNQRTLRPDSTATLIAAIVEANANGGVLSVGGFGSKRSWGHAERAATPLCTRALCAS